MINLRKKKDSMITTHELGEYIIGKGVVPTPIYSRNKESSYIVQPRGTIFAKIKRRSPQKF